MYDYRKFKPLPLKEIKIYKGKEKGTITYLDPAFYDSETSNDTDFDLGVEFVYAVSPMTISCVCPMIRM